MCVCVCVCVCVVDAVPISVAAAVPSCQRPLFPARDVVPLRPHHNKTKKKKQTKKHVQNTQFFLSTIRCFRAETNFCDAKTQQKNNEKEDFEA